MCVHAAIIIVVPAQLIHVHQLIYEVFNIRVASLAADHMMIVHV